jgi:hypothetical protein
MRARARLDPAGSSARLSRPMAPQWSQGDTNLYKIKSPRFTRTASTATGSISAFVLAPLRQPFNYPLQIGRKFRSRAPLRFSS